MMRRSLPEKFMNDDDFKRNFCPSGDVVEKSFCLDLGSAFFDSIKQGHATVQTDRIKAFGNSGIVLDSGSTIDCDVVIRADGLLHRPENALGTMAVSINGVHQVPGDHFEYKGCMLSGVPNFAFVDEAGTRHSDLVCRYVCRVLKAMDSKRSSICCPFQSDFLFPSARPQTMASQE